ncbi:MAG: tetratricopeptide repeat protein, partial [Candidatus Zixiibacteriota bacterium]
LCAGSARGDSFSSLNQKGNKAYKRGQALTQEGEKNKAVEAWEEALKHYRDAEIEKPENPELSYNIGNTIYRQEKYEDALERYFKALNSDELQHQAWTHYNLGNALYRGGKYPEAIQAYQKCLELTPEDEDAKFNLEFVRKKMKEMLDKEAKRQQEQKQQQQPQSEQQQQQQQEQQQTREDQDQAQQPQDEQKQQEQQREQLQPKEGMTEEDAERILNALKDDEKELLKKQKRAPRGDGRRGGKDW